MCRIFQRQKKNTHWNLTFILIWEEHNHHYLQWQSHTMELMIWLLALSIWNSVGKKKPELINKTYWTSVFDVGRIFAKSHTFCQQRIIFTVAFHHFQEGDYGRQPSESLCQQTRWLWRTEQVFSDKTYCETSGLFYQRYSCSLI